MIARDVTFIGVLYHAVRGLETHLSVQSQAGGARCETQSAAHWRTILGGMYVCWYWRAECDEEPNGYRDDYPFPNFC